MYVWMRMKERKEEYIERAKGRSFPSQLTLRDSSRNEFHRGFFWHELKLLRVRRTGVKIKESISKVQNENKKYKKMHHER